MNLAQRIEAIERMSGAERRREWERIMKASVPPAFGAGSLARALAYRLQEKALGGLASADLKRLRSLSQGGDPEVAAVPGSRSLRSGTWLSRTWHGEVHQVVVLDKGAEYRGKRYASLSAVAMEITGTHWSGPRFFGLGSPRLGSMEVRTNA